MLAPTDAAFAAMPADQLSSLMQPANVAQLQKLVAYHLINARLPSPEIKGHAATPVPSVVGVPVQALANMSNVALTIYMRGK